MKSGNGEMEMVISIMEDWEQPKAYKQNPCLSGHGVKALRSIGRKETDKNRRNSSSLKLYAQGYHAGVWQRLELGSCEDLGNSINKWN
jgi:hypothetical protein